LPIVGGPLFVEPSQTSTELPKKLTRLHRWLKFKSALCLEAKNNNVYSGPTNTSFAGPSNNAYACLSNRGPQQ